MYNISGKLKQLTMGAMLTTALAFLIIPPGMFVTVEAQVDSDYSFAELVSESISIAPIEESGWTPFHPGRLLRSKYHEDDLAYPMAAVTALALANAIAWVLIGYFTGQTIDYVVDYVQRKLRTSWKGLKRKSDRSAFERWARRYADLVGTVECKDHVNKGIRYANCVMDEWGYFIQEFVRQSNDCKSRERWWGITVRTKFYPDVTDQTRWVCAERNWRIPVPTWIPRFYWDTTPWTRL